eukprot:75729-Prymnesium_polylepis.1
MHGKLPGASGCFRDGVLVLSRLASKAHGLKPSPSVRRDLPEWHRSAGGRRRRSDCAALGPTRAAARAPCRHHLLLWPQLHRDTDGAARAMREPSEEGEGQLLVKWDDSEELEDEVLTVSEALQML